MKNATDALHKAQHTQTKDRTALQHDSRTLKQDKTKLVHEHDSLERDDKNVQHQSAVLGKVRDHELSQLHPLQKQRDALRTRFQTTLDPAVKQELDDKQLHIDELRARFDPSRLSERAKLDGMRATKQKVRTGLRAQKQTVEKDQRTVDGDKGALKKDGKAIAKAKPHDSVGGTVGDWISRAQSVLHAHGVSYSQMNAKDIATIIDHESGGDPKAVNNWDSNAAAGTPSEGLMQTIGPTFDEYKLKGHGHILNPVDNIVAGVRYAISRYGSVSNVPGVVAVKNGGSYVGY